MNRGKLASLAYESATRDIHNFAWGNMDWESAIDLIVKVSKSEYWIDYLLMEMELYEYFVNCKKGIAQPPEFEIG